MQLAKDLQALDEKHGITASAYCYMDSQADEVGSDAVVYCFVLDNHKASAITKDYHGQQIVKIFEKWLRVAGIAE
jgi:hypothetical protein